MSQEAELENQKKPFSMKSIKQQFFNEHLLAPIYLQVRFRAEFDKIRGDFGKFKKLRGYLFLILSEVLQYVTLPKKNFLTQGRKSTETQKVKVSQYWQCLYLTLFLFG